MRHGTTAAGNSASPTRNNVSSTAEYSWAQFASRYRARADAPDQQTWREPKQKEVKAVAAKGNQAGLEAELGATTEVKAGQAKAAVEVH